MVTQIDRFPSRVRAEMSQEYLLTVGISTDASSAATLMIYTQIVWALVLDHVFFHKTPNSWTLLGVALVVANLCLVSFVKNEKAVLVHHHTLNDDEGAYTEMSDIVEFDS